MTMAQFSRDDILLYQGREEGREEGKKIGAIHTYQKLESRLKQPDNTSWRNLGQMQRKQMSF